MKRRSAIALVVVAVIVLVAAALLRWAMQPQVLGPRVIAMAAQATGLEITAGDFDYRLRGTPQLVARGVSARTPGAVQPLLEVERILVSLPWSTLRSRGSDLVITRIEIDAPRLQLQPSLDWWKQRPQGDGTLPTIKEGVHVRDGRLQAAAWSVEDLHIQLPHFAPQARLGANINGRYRAGTFEVPFHLHAAMTRPAMEAGIGVAGMLSPRGKNWQLPAYVVASSRLTDSTANAGVGLAGLRVSTSARYLSDGTAEALVLGLAGEGVFAGGGFTLQPAALAVRGRGMIPHLQGRGRLDVGEQMQISLAGHLERWPAAWPVLPPPIGDSSEPLPFELGYRGATSLSDPLLLRLSRGQARFDGELRVSDIVSWAGDFSSGSPLPPLDGRLTVPRVDIAGASLHGVEITVTDGPLPAEPQP